MPRVLLIACAFLIWVGSPAPVVSQQQPAQTCRVGLRPVPKHVCPSLQQQVRRCTRGGQPQPVVVLGCTGSRA